MLHFVICSKDFGINIQHKWQPLLPMQHKINNESLYFVPVHIESNFIYILIAYKKCIQLFCYFQQDYLNSLIEIITTISLYNSIIRYKKRFPDY